MPYEITVLFEVYAIDSGGIGQHCGTKGYFTKYEDALDVLALDAFQSMTAIPTIKIGNDYFPLSSTRYPEDRLCRDPKYFKYNKSEFLERVKPVPVDVNTISQKKKDEKRRQELLNSFSEDDKRVLGLS